MTWVINSTSDLGDGVRIGGKQTPPQPTHIPHRTMTNTELTLDQLQVVSGGKSYGDGEVKFEAKFRSKYINDAGTQGSIKCIDDPDISN